ncbi:Gfo/Idh/MocA family oxidoreductase [Streptomyces sp. NPDC002785]|uniref:Gfo/Idh/MocA family protein n=1 Tax=Streptomyces sp. NPDC002785 TaxID=3154543 RepID=UPI00331902A5
MKQPLQVLLIGAGTRTRKVYGPWLSGLPPYQAEPVRPLAVLDTDTEAARNVARDLPGAAAARPQDLDRILTGSRPDLVVVATPDASHRDYVARALAAGCTTLVEKPLATTVEDAFALVHAAEDTSARLLVGHNLRFTNVHSQVRALLASGHIGTVTGADFHYTLGMSHSRSYFTRWHRTRAASGGLQVTKASHHLDLLAWWLGAHPIAVTALLEHRHYLPGKDGIPADADIHDSLHALIQYTSGATVHYALTLNAPAEGYTCTLRGTEGVCTVHYDARSGPHTVHLHTNSGGDGARWRIAREEGTHAGADRRMLMALPQAVAPGTPPNFATAAEAALAVATGTTMYDSSRQGRRLPVPQPTAPGEPR